MIRIVSLQIEWALWRSNMLRPISLLLLLILSCLVCYTSNQRLGGLQLEAPFANSIPESPSATAFTTVYLEQPSYSNPQVDCTDTLNSISSLGCASIEPTFDGTGRIICVPYSQVPQLVYSTAMPLSANHCRVLLPASLLPSLARLPDRGAEELSSGSRNQRVRRDRGSPVTTSDGSVVSEEATAGNGDTPNAQVMKSARRPDGSVRCDDGRCSEQYEEGDMEDTYAAGRSGEGTRREFDDTNDGQEVYSYYSQNSKRDGRRNRALLSSDSFRNRLLSQQAKRANNEYEAQVEVTQRYEDEEEVKEMLPQTQTQTRTSSSSNLDALLADVQSQSGGDRAPVLLVKLVDTNGGRRIAQPAMSSESNRRLIAGSRTGAQRIAFSGGGLKRPSIRVHRSELMKNGTMAPPTSTLYMDLATYQSMLPLQAAQEASNEMVGLPMLNAGGVASRTAGNIDLDGGMSSGSSSRYEQHSEMAATRATNNHQPATSGALELPPTCNLSKYAFKATKSDAMGNSCSGWVKANICYGACQTGEIADWLFPYKKSIHKVCTHGSRVRRQVQLTNCTSSEVEQSLREYHLVDATSCVCKKCSSADTVCMGSITSATLDDNPIF